MTDQVRTGLRDRIGQQSGFLSPALIVLLLAVVNRLPEEEGRDDQVAIGIDPVAPDKESSSTFIKARQVGEVTVTFEDGTEIPLNGPAPRIEPSASFLVGSYDHPGEARVTAEMTVLPPLQESYVWDRVADLQMQALAGVFGIPPNILEEINQGNAVVTRDSHGRVQVSAFAGPEIDYLDGTWAEEIAFITELYFGPNPFYEYPYRLGITWDPISNGVRVSAILDYDENLMLLGEIDFVRERVGYADPDTGWIMQYVPLLPAHWSGRGSEGNRMAQQARDYRPYSGYCTPHRDTLTAPHCQCADCRGARLYEPASLREGRRQRLASIYRPDGTPVFEEA
jgi:hypothetical protein